MRVENMNTYPYRTYAEIDLNKMQHNLRQVRAAIGPDCKLLFVLKADAYGHGTPVCAKYSEELVDWYAVATIDEALSIRRAGVEKPILLFGALQDRRSSWRRTTALPSIPVLWSTAATWRRFCSGAASAWTATLRSTPA